MKTTLQRFADRAAAEGLLDVAYATMDSPFGPLLLASTKRGLVRVGLPNQDAEGLLDDLATRVSPRVLEAPAQLDEPRRELDLYFEGRLRTFELPLDWQLSRRLPRQGAARDRQDPLRADTQLHRDGRTSRKRAGGACRRHGAAAPTRSRSSSPVTASCAAAAVSAATEAACR